MSVRIGIHGYGYGISPFMRLVGSDPQIEVVAIDVPAAAGELARSRGRDGKLADNLSSVEEAPLTRSTREDSEGSPWGELDVDYVVDCQSPDLATAAAHLHRGAMRVIVTEPMTDRHMIPVLVPSVNTQRYHPATDHVLSLPEPSATACAVLIAAIGRSEIRELAITDSLHEHNGGAQPATARAEHHEVRRSEQAAPAARRFPDILAEILPGLASQITVSRLDLPAGRPSAINVELVTHGAMSVEQLRDRITSAAAEELRGLLRITSSEDGPGTSAPESCCVEPDAITSHGHGRFSVVCWCGSETAHAHRMIELIRLMWHSDRRCRSEGRRES